MRARDEVRARARRVARAAVALSVVWLASRGAPVAAQGAQAAQPDQAAQAAQPAADWRLRSLDGRVVALGELRGRPVVVNAWATWCAPCVVELRSLERLATSLDGSPVAFAMVAPQALDHVRDWVRRRGYRLAFYVEESPAPPGLGLEALPTTWILDADGRVVLKRRGAADWDRDDVRALLLRLAADGEREDGG